MSHISGTNKTIHEAYAMSIDVGFKKGNVPMLRRTMNYLDTLDDMDFFGLKAEFVKLVFSPVLSSFSVSFIFHSI